MRHLRRAFQRFCASSHPSYKRYMLENLAFFHNSSKTPDDADIANRKHYSAPAGALTMFSYMFPLNMMFVVISQSLKRWRSQKFQVCEHPAIGTWTRYEPIQLTNTGKCTSSQSLGYVSKLGTLQNYPPLKLTVRLENRPSQKEISLPTIHFLVYMLVSLFQVEYWKSP